MKNNTWVVLQREYTTRVKKKGFFIMTILAPLLLVGLMFVPLLLTKVSDNTKTYALVDETGIYLHSFENSKHVFEVVPDTAAAIRGMDEEKYSGLLWIRAGSLDSNHQSIKFLYNQSEPSVTALENISSMAENTLRMELIRRNTDLDPAVYRSVSEANVEVVAENIQTGERSYTEVKSLIAYVAGFLIYGFVFLFGSQIMSGVIEEKSNRIIEVMISSVKPFQLLMGKVLGLALVGLTQLLLWGILTLVLTMAVGFFAGGNMDMAQMSAMQPSAMPGMEMNEVQQMLSEIHQILVSLHLDTFLLFFLIYFLGGYLLYASLFAAVGSAVENQEDTNQFMWPITVPMIIGLISLSTVFVDSNGPVAFWLSIIPFTSPMVMVARILFGVPAWELCLSIGLLVLSFIGTTWLAGRIYRVGILMYGKKGSYKELWRWIRYKG